MRVRKELKQEIIDKVVSFVNTIYIRSPEAFAEKLYEVLAEIFRERERLAYMRGAANERKKHVKVNTDTNSGS